MTNPQVESLLEHDTFLRVMARRLLGDDAQADDIVQEAWLVALKSAKRPDEVRASWLLGIVKNLVRRARRDVERRTRRERTAAKCDAVTPTDEACAERALRRKIAEIVVALPAIYRDPLLLRYYDGLTPQAIAERLELPGSTVRTRLQRGLARVKNGIEGGNGNHRSLAVALLAIAAKRPARTAPRAAAVAAVLVLSVLLARTPPDRPLHSARETRATAQLMSARAATAPEVELPTSPSADAGARAGDAALLLEGVVRLPPGAVETTVHLEVASLRADVPGDRPFALDVSWAPRGAALHVRATHAESEPFETIVEVPGRLEAQLRRRVLVPEEQILAQLGPEEGEEGAAGEEGGAAGGDAGSRLAPKGTALEGVVHLPTGVSDARAFVEVWRDGAAHVKSYVRGGARFSIGVAALLEEPRPAELRVRASHPDTAQKEVVVPVLFDPATGAPVLPPVEIDLFAAAVLEGVVTLEGFGPAPDATVAIFPCDAGVPSEQMFAAARTSGTGSFRVPVERGHSYLVTASAPSYAPAGVVVVAEGDTAVQGLLLRRGFAIAGSVRNAGAPAAGATVRAALRDSVGRTLPLSRNGDALAFDANGLTWRSVVAASGADGAFLLPGLDARAYRLEVLALLDGTAPPYSPLEVTAPGAADFDIPVARLSVSARGGMIPLPGASVDARREDGSSISRVADGSGQALLLARPGERLHVTVSAPGFVKESRDLLADTIDVVFDLRPDIRQATLVVLLRSADDLPLPSVCAFELDDSRTSVLGRKATVEDGQFVLRNLEPGDFTVVASLGGSFLPAKGHVRLERGQTAVLALDVRAMGKVVLRILTKDAMPDVWIEGATDFGDPGSARWTVKGDTLESGLLTPGHYVVHVLDPLSPRSFAIEVKPGETARFLVPLG